MDKKNLIIKLFKSLRGEKESFFLSVEQSYPQHQNSIITNINLLFDLKIWFFLIQQHVWFFFANF
jgi:hypothetical protein